MRACSAWVGEADMCGIRPADPEFRCAGHSRGEWKRCRLLAGDETQRGADGYAKRRAHGIGEAGGLELWAFAGDDGMPQRLVEAHRLQWLEANRE